LKTLHQNEHLSNKKNTEKKIALTENFLKLHKRFNIA